VFKILNEILNENGDSGKVGIGGYQNRNFLTPKQSRRASVVQKHIISLQRTSSRRTFPTNAFRKTRGWQEEESTGAATYGKRGSGGGGGGEEGGGEEGEEGEERTKNGGN